MQEGNKGDINTGSDEQHTEDFYKFGHVTPPLFPSLATGRPLVKGPRAKDAKARLVFDIINKTRDARAVFKKTRQGQGCGVNMNKESLLRIVSGTAALVISTVFGAAYSWVNMANAGYHNSGANLPWATALFSRVAPFGIMLPFVFAIFGFYVCRKKDTDHACHILLHAGYLFSFAWALLSVWAWFLPNAAIGGLAP